MTHTSLHRRALLAAAGLAFPALAFAQASAPPPPTSPSQAGPFRFKGWQGQDTDAERGFLDVAEDRRDPRSRKIRLSYVRFASTAAKPGPPIVYLAGGPGGTATRALSGPRFPIMMALREVADVIAFDQRGSLFQLLFGRIQPRQCRRTGDRFNTPHAGCHTTFAGDLEQRDVACTGRVNTATQLDGETAAHAQHPHVVAILFAKQRHGTFGLGSFDIGFFGFNRTIQADFTVDDVFQRL